MSSEPAVQPEEFEAPLRLPSGALWLPRRSCSTVVGTFDYS
jgi:hypothetical protein